LSEDSLREFLCVICRSNNYFYLTLNFDDLLFISLRLRHNFVYQCMCTFNEFRYVFMGLNSFLCNAKWIHCVRSVYIWHCVWSIKIRHCIWSFTSLYRHICLFFVLNWRISIISRKNLFLCEGIVWCISPKIPSVKNRLLFIVVVHSYIRQGRPYGLYILISVPSRWCILWIKCCPWWWDCLWFHDWYLLYDSLNNKVYTKNSITRAPLWWESDRLFQIAVL
jgi:hypothetical protein